MMKLKEVWDDMNISERILVVFFSMLIISCFTFMSCSKVFAFSGQGPYVLLNAVTATGPGGVTKDLQYSGVTLVNDLPHYIVCTLTWGGTVPTSVNVAVNGSNDNVNFTPLKTFTVTAIGTDNLLIHNGYTVRYIQGNYISKVGGDGTTSVTMTCWTMQ